MQHRTRLMVFALACMFAMGLGVPTAEAQDVIKIGMTNSFSGPLQNPATKVWQGVRVWEEWANAQGGIMVKDQGKKLKVKLVFYDDETNRENLTRLYERLAVSDDVDFYFGPFGSGQTYVVAAIADKHKKLMISTTASSPKIYSQGYDYIIQGIMQSDEFGRPYIDLIHKVDPDHKKLAMVWENHLFPKSVATLVRKQAEEMGFDIVFFDKFPFGAQDVTPILTRARQSKPDHIYILANISGSILAVRQAAELKLQARSIGILDNGMVYYKKALGDKLLNTIIGPVEWDASQNYNIDYGPDNAAFAEWHEKVFPGKEFDNHTPMGFNAGLLLQRAIEEAGSLDTKKVRQVFCTLKMTTLIGPQRWACDTGMMHRRKDGGLPTLVTQWREDGSTVTVWPPEFGDLSKLVFPKKPW